MATNKFIDEFNARLAELIGASPAKDSSAM